MNEAPPVTKTRFPVQKVSAGFTLIHPYSIYFSPRAGAADNFHKFLQLFDSIIGWRRRQRCAAHSFDSRGICRQFAYHAYHFFWSIGIGAHAESQ
jgi:hypothetical protein